MGSHGHVAHTGSLIEGQHVTLRAVVRRVFLSLLVACVVPAALFYGCFELSGVALAMGSALAWAYGATAFRALTGRQVSGMLVITSVVLTVRTAVAVAAHSDFLYFVQPALSDAALGVGFLVSLLTARPMAGKLAGDFYPVCERVSALPRMRTLFYRLTAGWAVYLLVKAALIVFLLTHLSTAGYVQTMSMANPVLNLSAAAVTIAMSAAALRREGLLGAAVPVVPPLVVPV